MPLSPSPSPLPYFGRGDRGESGVIYHKTEYRERRDHFAYFACSEPLAGFDTQRETFLGPYRGWDSPRAVEAGQTSGLIACGWQPIGVHHVKVTLRAGEQKKDHFPPGLSRKPKRRQVRPARIANHQQAYSYADHRPLPESR